jgi:3-oxoacyl-[acyl-carrier protein] reductase
MLLKNKNAVIYGGAGAVGSSVAKAFAAQGANVFLAGRTIKSLDAVAKQIIDAGGFAETAIVDALDKEAVENFISKILKKSGSIDISFNAIGVNDEHGKPLINMSCDQFTLPVTIAVKSYFITGTVAAKHMIKKQSGVILALTADAGYDAFPNVGGFGVTCAAIEGFCRQLAVEVGQYGVRVVCLRSAGSPDAPGVDKVLKQHAKNEGITRQEFEKRLAEKTMLKRLPKLEEVANAAVLMASDKASAITAAVINITCGAIAD